MAERGPSTVRDVTRTLLRELGMTTVFGNPGSTELGFLGDWPDDFRYVLGLQELCVVSMADGFAQFSGNAALANLHSVGGVGHAMGGIATAFRNNSPVVVLSGQQSRELLTGEPFLGSVDATVFPRPYVKWAVEPARAADVPAALARAYQVAMQAPRGPVLVSVPADDWAAPAEPVAIRRPDTGFAPDPDRLTELADALRTSDRPAIVVGAAVDADGASAGVVALAELLNAPVLAAPMSGRCSFPEEHPLFAGFLAPARSRLATALAPYDLVLVVGAPAFVQHVVTEERGPDLPPLFLLGDNDTALAWAPEGTSVRGGPRLGVTALLRELDPADRPSPPPRRRPAPPTPSYPLTAPYVLAQLAALLPDDAVVVEEVPSHRNALHDYLPIRRPGGFLTEQSGALGFALPAAIGVALARPDRPVVALIGDGAGMYSIQGLWTAAREQVPVTFVVLDNGQYAAVHQHAADLGYAKMPAIELGGIDFRGLAENLGCAAEYVDRPELLAPSVGAALASDRPTLLHVPVSPHTAPMY
jgi:benzoylformate decarboxylase